MGVGLDFKLRYNINMQFIKKNLIIVLSIAFLTFLPISMIFAAEGKVGTIDNPLGSNGPTSIQAFLLKILEGAIKIGTPIIVLAVIYCGFLFVKAQGNPEEITKAKEALMYTLIGAAILLGAVAISRLIIDTVTTITA